MKLFRWTVGLAILLFSFGCQTMPDTFGPSARASRDFNATSDQVWEACVASVAGLPILEMDRERGRIATDWFDPSRQGPAREPATDWPGTRREITNQERINIRVRPADGATRAEVAVARQGYTSETGASEGDRLDTVTWSLTVPSTRARRVLNSIAETLAGP